jgi:hypothetical protein
MPRYKAACEDRSIMLACGEREAMNRQNGSAAGKSEQQRNGNGGLRAGGGRNLKFHRVRNEQKSAEKSRNVHFFSAGIHGQGATILDKKYFKIYLKCSVSRVWPCFFLYAIIEPSCGAPGPGSAPDGVFR